MAVFDEPASGDWIARYIAASGVARRSNPVGRAKIRELIAGARRDLDRYQIEVRRRGV
jgi:hypothetical protein